MTTGGCCATNPGVGHCALLSGRSSSLNEDDCAIVVEGNGWVKLREFLDRTERVAENLREGNTFTASLVEKDGMVGDSGWWRFFLPENSS